MDRVAVIVVCSCLVGAVAVADGNGKAHHGEGTLGDVTMLRHANPMPGPMPVVNEYAERLGLSDAQRQSPADWRAHHHQAMRVRFTRVTAVEATLNRAASSMRGLIAGP